MRKLARKTSERDILVAKVRFARDARGREDDTTKGNNVLFSGTLSIDLTD